MSHLKKLRERAVERLIRDLKAIDSNDLEYFAYAIAQLIQGRALVHRGLSIKGRPVGYTVDIFDLPHDVISECSAEAGYFEEGFSKLRGDIRHAKAKNPDCLRLYLFSAEECPNNQQASLGAAIKEETFGSCIIEVYDARRSAEAIFDRVVIANNQLDQLADLLPALRQLFDEYIFEQAVPPRPADFVSDPARATAVHQALAGAQIVVIGGLSGSGKSYSAKDYVATHGAVYAATFWVAGSDISNVADLRAVPISRLGVKLNLAYQLKDNPCLLVVDSYEDDFGSLHRLFQGVLHPGSRVLVTSQLRPAQFHLCDLPELSDTAVVELLARDVPAPATVEEIEAILRIVGRNPLVLSVIRGVVRDLGTRWRTLIDDIRENLGAYETSDHQRIIDRILGHHQRGIEEELRLLRWISGRLFDTRFAEQYFGIAGLQKLIRRSILKPAEGSYLRVHDLVATCISGLPTAENDAAEIKFWKYFEQHWEASPYHFQRSLHLHRDRLQDRVDPDVPQPSLRSYLCLLIGRSTFSSSGVSFLASQPLGPHLTDRAATAAIVEAIEQQWRESGEGSQSKLLVGGIARLTEALSLTMPNSVRWDLIHHRGKFLRWAKQYAAAKDDFLQVISGRPDSWSAHLQVARVLAAARIQGSSEYLDRILKAFESDEHSVPSTVILAALGELGRRENNRLRQDILGNRIDILRRAVSLSMVEGFSQPYQMLGRIGRYLFYNQPLILIKLVSEIGFPTAADAHQDECFDLGECLKLVGKAYQEQKSDALGLQRWCERAMEYYTRVPSPDGFRLTMHAECALLLQDFGFAEKLLQEVKEIERRDHWWHRYAQALRGLGHLKKARLAADCALQRLEDETYRSAFLRTRSLIEFDDGDSCCIATIKQAGELAEEPKFRDQLAREMNAYCKGLPKA